MKTGFNLGEAAYGSPRRQPWDEITSERRAPEGRHIGEWRFRDKTRAAFKFPSDVAPPGLGHDGCDNG